MFKKRSMGIIKGTKELLIQKPLGEAVWRFA